MQTKQSSNIAPCIPTFPHLMSDHKSATVRTQNDQVLGRNRNRKEVQGSPVFILYAKVNKVENRSGCPKKEKQTYTVARKNIEFAYNRMVYKGSSTINY